MYCTEGKKRSYVCAYNEKKNKRKKSSGKRKNLAQTDWFNSDDRIKASSNHFAWFDMKKNLLFSENCFISLNKRLNLSEILVDFLRKTKNSFKRQGLSLSITYQ